MSALPSGWVEVELGELFRGNRRSSVVPAKESDRRFELYSVPSFETGAPERLYGSEIGSSKQEVAAGSVLLCRINPRINRVWVVGEAGSDPQIASTEWVSLPRVAGITPRFAMQALRTPQVRRHLTSSVSGVGGSLMRVRMDALWRTKIPLAPLPEQHRIVAKIESLFARLDEGISALKRAEANLERYRASVLKAAVEGRLTERWRRENPPEETGEDLLRRILAERRKRWDAEQLAKFEAKGRKPPKNWRAKYKEPVTPDTSGLPGLPEEWCWASFEALCDVQLGKMLSRTAREGAENRRLYLRNSNVRWFSIDESDLKSMSFKESELNRYAVRRGDLLVCEGGEPGRCSVYKGPDATLMYQKALHRARPHLADVSTEFLQYCLAHQVAHGIGMPRYSETTIRHLTLEKIKAVPLPVAPAIEQRRIARRVAEQRAILVKETAATLTVSIQGASRLRQSILKRAFEGRLVPQDPDDEPASVLLERIRAEREGVRKKSKRRPMESNLRFTPRVP